MQTAARWVVYFWWHEEDGMENLVLVEQGKNAEGKCGDIEMGPLEWEFFDKPIY